MSCLPLELTNMMSSKYDNCWDKVEEFVSKLNDKGVVLNKHCIYPISAGAHVVINDKYAMMSTGTTEERLELVSDATAMVTLAGWRKHKQIYRFEKEMQDLLLDQGNADLVLPVEVLYEIPYDCIYIQLNDVMTEQEYVIDGFFVSFEQDINTMEMELRFLVVYSNGITSAIPIHLSEGMTIADGIKKTIQIAQDNKDIDNKYNIDNIDIQNWGNNVVDTAAKFLQLVLYICSQNKEIEENPVQKKITKKPVGNNIKDKFREVQMWDCGKETSEKIRKINLNNKKANYAYEKSSSDGHGSAKSPHSRRGHWHHFWVGKHNSEERHIVLKWVAPTFVNGGSENDINVNIII